MSADRDQGSFVSELQSKIGKQIKVPKGYSIIFGGQYENLERAGKQLSLTIPLTIIIVFVFLFMLFKNMKQTFVTMSCILFALAGGIFALFLRGYHFNVSAGVGFVSIFGISVMAGVLLVSAFMRDTHSACDHSAESLKAVAGTQFRAILMMLIVAIIGLIPAATSTGIGSDVQRPLATVIIGGLTFTLLFAPTVLPSLYYWAVVKAAKPEKVKPKEEIL
ncbi:MAG: efflux RND transporter permease subunit [Chitinophagaceae bacterium]